VAKVGFVFSPSFCVFGSWVVGCGVGLGGGGGFVGGGGGGGGNGRRSSSVLFELKKN